MGMMQSPKLSIVESKDGYRAVNLKPGHTPHILVSPKHAADTANKLTSTHSLTSRHQAPISIHNFGSNFQYFRPSLDQKQFLVSHLMASPVQKPSPKQSLIASSRPTKEQDPFFTLHKTHLKQNLSKKSPQKTTSILSSIEVAPKYKVKEFHHQFQTDIASIIKKSKEQRKKRADMILKGIQKKDEKMGSSNHH